MKIKTRMHLFLITAVLNFSTICAYAQKNEKYAEMPAMIKQIKLNGDTALAKNVALNYINNYLFKNRKYLLTRENLGLMRQYLISEHTKAFKYFFKNRAKINEIIGENSAEYAIKEVIRKAYLPKNETWKVSRPDWDNLEKKLTKRFGSLGQETVFSGRLMYSLDIGDWDSYGKYYILYFEKALKRPDFIVNNMSWYLFENVNEQKALHFACDVVMVYAIKEWYQTDPGAFDTYANLLYKVGRVTEAIEWQKKAVEIAKNTPHEDENKSHLEKMLRGERTWLAH